MVTGMAEGKTKILFVAIAYLFLLVSAGKRTREGGDGEAEADRIVKLPGQPKVKFQQFSGYVTVNKEAGRALFYYFTEAVRPKSKPLIIWFNGGPGCSSLAFGASEEIGPFRIKTNGTGLTLNRFSWNKVANLLFIESPAGVGFSYTNTSSDLLNFNDQKTATDALEFINRWLDRFSHYKERDIYLAGESYAGHYIPQLTIEILKYNSNTKSHINLQGILIGNGSTDKYFDNTGMLDYLLSHGLISDEKHSELLKKCHSSFTQDKDTDECNAVINELYNDLMGNIDTYNIYQTQCLNPYVKGANPKIQRLPYRQRSPASSVSKQLAGYDPCTERYSMIYYNKPDVQKALHANTTNISYNWTTCSETLFDKWNGTAFTILPVYKEIIAAGLKIWLYSGDADSVVPVTSTRYCLAQLNLTTKIRWYPWYLNNEVAGWTQVYEELTFATVRGAGHEVPHGRPKQALQLIKSFLSGTPLSSK